MKKRHVIDNERDVILYIPRIFQLFDRLCLFILGTANIL